MNVRGKFATTSKQRGAALLIAIFALLLISVVAIALLVSSGTDTALANNYRTSTGAYYAALAGLEEGRGRLLPKNADFVNNQVPNFIPPAGATLDVHQVLYIINPANGETVAPTDPSNAYADTEYSTENSWGFGGAQVQPLVNSDSPQAGLPGPSYKWVRINPVTEVSMGNVSVDGANPPDGTTPLFYDGFSLNRASSGSQAMEITTLAVLPNGTRKMLQYVVGPSTLNFAFPAALTLVGSPGNNVLFTGPGTPTFFVNGNDQYPVGNCLPTAPPVPAIGYAGGNANGINAAPAANYTGSGVVPSVASVFLPANAQTPAALTNLILKVAANADANLTPVPPATSVMGADLPNGMAANNPMTVVVNGDLDLTNWHGVGYGLLIVTGTLTYDPDATWNGIVLVVGKGVFTSNRGGSHQFNGAVLIANTVDNTGALLPQFGPANFSQIGGNPSGSGIYFSSCNIQMAQQPSTYKVLSFREIPLAN